MSPLCHGRVQHLGWRMHSTDRPGLVTEQSEVPSAAWARQTQRRGVGDVQLLVFTGFAASDLLPKGWIHGLAKFRCIFCCVRL